MQTTPGEVEEYDLIILGSGEGGKYLAWNLAKEGQKVAVVERKYVGGSCPNIACLPSKNFVHSAKVALCVAGGALRASGSDWTDRYGGGSRAQAQDGRWPRPDA